MDVSVNNKFDALKEKDVDDDKELSTDQNDQKNDKWLNTQAEQGTTNEDGEKGQIQEESQSSVRDQEKDNVK